MTKRPTSPLALVPTSQFPSFDSRPAPLPLGRPLTRDERRVAVERDLELACIAVAHQIGEQAITAIDAIYQHAFTEFDRAAGEMLALAAEARGSEHQRYVEAYLRQLLPRLAHHNTGIIEVTAHLIAQEVHHTKRPAPEPLSLLEKLLGRRD